MLNKPRTVPVLFCKPDHPNFVHAGPFYVPGKTEPQIIAFRSLSLKEDLAQIHEWVNAPYAQSFWNMTGSSGLLQACYQCIQQNPHGHSFAGMLNERLICQFDVYRVQADELNEHLNVSLEEAGFHLIMAPVDRTNLPARGLTLAIIQTFLDWYFSFEEATVMWAEPDVNNGRSVRLLKLLGFDFIKTVQMSYKQAHVYRLTKETWLSSH